MSLFRCMSAVVLLTSALACRAESLVLLTENLAPFNMAANGSNFARNEAVIGISADTMRLVCQRANIECQQILRFPWDRVYEQALKEPGYGLFSVARTPERESLFKWVGPIASNDWVLLSRGDQPIQLDNLEQARRYSLGGYKGDAISQRVIDSGLEVKLALNDKENAELLATRQIDLWVTSVPAGLRMARQLGYNDFQVALRFQRADLYLALNKATPDDVVSRLSDALEALRREGKLQALEQAY